MTQRVPAFSIIIPTYNRAHLIGKTLQSVLDQQFADFEILVIDDGSKDNTDEVVKGFSDSRIHYHKKENAERGAARNYGTARAKGLYVNFFDSDDLMYSNHLAVASKYIQPPYHWDFFHLGYDFQTNDGNVLNTVSNFTDATGRQVLFDNKLSCNGVFLKREIALQFPFEEDRRMASSEDWHLWIRLLCHTQFHYSNEVTSSVVNHDTRSLFTIAPDRVESRDLLLIDRLKHDPAVMLAYGSSFNRFIAERYSFFMLCYSQQRQRSKVFRWAARALKVYPLILANKRFLASIKNSLV